MSPRDQRSTRVSLIQRLSSAAPDDGDWNREWTALANQYSPVILRLALSAKLGESAARDIIQETLFSLLKLFTKKDKPFNYDPNQTFGGLVTRIAVNMIRNEHRRRQRRELKHDELDALELGQVAQTQVNKQGAELRAELTQAPWEAALEQCLAQLSDKERRILLHADTDADLVADGVCPSENAARVARNRAKKKLIDGLKNLPTEVRIADDSLFPTSRLELLREMLLDQASPSPTPCLWYRDEVGSAVGGSRPAVLSLALDGELVIGSSTFSVRDPWISGQHCRFTPTATADWELTDLGSRNGTRVNGVALEKGHSHTLRDGDVIEVGHKLLVFSNGAPDVEVLEDPS